MIVVAIIGLLMAIAFPNFISARTNTREKLCVNNLRQLDAAKEEAALEKGLTSGADVAPFVADYLKKGVPTCPEGHVAYDLHLVGTDPECKSSFALDHNTAYHQ